MVPVRRYVPKHQLAHGGVSSPKQLPSNNYSQHPPDKKNTAEQVTSFRSDKREILGSRIAEPHLAVSCFLKNSWLSCGQKNETEPQRRSFNHPEALEVFRALKWPGFENPKHLRGF